jgi:hypothetical protein
MNDDSTWIKNALSVELIYGESQFCTGMRDSSQIRQIRKRPLGPRDVSLLLQTFSRFPVNTDLLSAVHGA